MPHRGGLSRRTARRMLRGKKRPEIGILTRNQAQQVKTLLKEEKDFKDVYHQMTDLTTTLASVQPDGTAAGPFFTLDGEDPTATDEAPERDGNSVSPVSLDLRVSLNFASPHEQMVRLILVSFGDDDGRSGAQILHSTVQSTTNPFNVIQSFRKMNPDIKYKIIKDIVISSKPVSMANGETTASRTRNVRLVHKFKGKDRLNYASLANEEPDTNAIYLYAVYAQGRLTAGGNYANSVAPSIAFTCRQRYIR